MIKRKKHSIIGFGSCGRGELLKNDEIRKNISQNLVKFRTASGLTQSALAQKINYSDKSVSKWERGDGTPDIFVLSTLADFFGVSVDDFLSSEGGKTVPNKPRLQKHKHLIINLLAVGLVWLVAVTLFVLLNLILGVFNIDCSHNAVVFLFAVPASGIVQTVFSELWWNKLSTLIAVSVIIWGCVATMYVLFVTFGFDFAHRDKIFLISAVLQVLAILWFFLRMVKQKAKTE